MEELAQCPISYREAVHRFDDGAVVLRFDPGGHGEVWRGGECLLRLSSKLMTVYEAALMRKFLREPPLTRVPDDL